MKLEEKNMEKTAAAPAQDNVWGDLVSSNSLVTEKSYHEMEEQSVQEMDHLTRLQTNILMLADLQSRLSFVMREVKYLTKA